jgi:hypothetical protein
MSAQRPGDSSRFRHAEGRAALELGGQGLASNAGYVFARIGRATSDIQWEWSYVFIPVAQKWS